jgi:hypothetical protein
MEKKLTGVGVELYAHGALLWLVRRSQRRKDTTFLWFAMRH